MYSTLLILHSLFRWLVAASLTGSILFSWRGIKHHLPFSTGMDQLRHWTATIAHLQLMIGLTLYFKSPLTRLSIPASGNMRQELMFFKYAHILMMIISIILLTIGSAKAKRAEGAALKYKTVLIWYSIALLIILAAIPWPFSPLAARPYMRF
ncbi:hypothetical protein [Pedobacter sp. JY14-1]|uniref:hypothetical protein n=1 Tax=Pedobacter sp. JY14-1 TaxID=3034151 RepID=UPI0023E093D6|nr:hypothetical protein [Pedobacter sp. JY14-1]